MKISRVVIIIVAVVLVGIVALFAYETLSSPKISNSSSWGAAAAYPLQLSGTFGVAGQQCVNDTNYIICVGGQDYNGGPRNEVYTSSYISATTTNITSWTADSDVYPQSINGQACVTYSGYVYCVGGTYNDAGDDTASSYYAPVGSNGNVGPWNSTTPYPIAVDSQYCVSSSGYIYCVGGNNETDGTNADAASSNSVWYAALSSSGIGAWSHSNAYPSNLYFPSCFAYGAYIYCVGAADGNNNPQSTDYFAPLSNAGVGTWTETTTYPIQVTGQACSFDSGTVYCLGGQGSQNSYTSSIYYASVSSAGIGSWKDAKANYPEGVQTTCIALLGYMYCVGGFDGSSAGETDGTYFAPITSISTTTTS
jgi:hypothetical protein